MTDHIEAAMTMEELTVAQVRDALLNEDPATKIGHTQFWRCLGVSPAMKQVSEFAQRVCTLLEHAQRQAAACVKPRLRFASALGHQVSLYKSLMEMTNPANEHTPAECLSLNDTLIALRDMFSDNQMYHMAYVWESIRETQFWEQPGDAEEDKALKILFLVRQRANRRRQPDDRSHAGG